MIIKDKGLRLLSLAIVIGALALIALNIFVLYPKYTEGVILQAEREAIRLASHLSSTVVGGGKDDLSLEGFLSMVIAEDKIKRIQKDFKVVKLKIFLPSGETLYSTTPEDIGKINSRSYFHEVVAKGSPYTKVVRKENKSLEGQTVAADVVETYVPIMVAGEFVGVYEIYYDVTEQLANLHQLTTFSSILLISSIGLFQLLITFGILLLDKKIIENKKARKELEGLAADLVKANSELRNTQAQMLQREKMASLGQLAAGVAHEINNPMGFVTSNLGTLKKYVDKFIGFIETQARALTSLSAADLVADAKKKLKLDFLVEDTNDLLAESLDGAKRITEIVQNLKSFSRVDAAVNASANINDCLESTLKIIWNELKYKTKVHKEYGDLPLTLCNPQELNQVFMNILMNAVQAIADQGDITIHTWQEGDHIRVSIADTGSGIAKDKIEHIFEPFFTTKEVGKGTGLGLAISYDIVKKHGGDILVESEVGKGTVFAIKLPVRKAE